MNQLDRRLVRTFFLTLAAMVRLRHSRSGLLLSELGAHILSPQQAPAGTKRLSNLLRSPKWSHTLLERFLWYRAGQTLDDLKKTGESPLALWDESVLEKPESIALEGLGPVRSSKAARLKRIKPGYYTDTTRILQSPWRPTRIRTRPAVDRHHDCWLFWATHPGCHALVDQARPRATDRSTNLTALLDQCCEKWGQQVVHVWDRGFAGAPWLKELTSRRLRFIMRWHTGYYLTDDQGSRHAWRIARGKRSLQTFPGPSAALGPSIVVSTVRPTSSICRSATIKWTSPCGWWFPAQARDVSPGTC